ncbi:MAG: flagellar biosynthetic protein FliR [Deltaproteobacteria bacterium]|nr:flagellar biosynthetic protein FliR [Deltaproteobacteria bacterium]
MDAASLILANSSTFLFVLVRTSAILMTAPVFGIFNIPMRVKAGLAFVISLLLTQMTGHVPMPSTITGLVISVGGELLVGASIGLVARFIFAGIEFAGQFASLQMGIGLASAYDPVHNAQINVLGKLLSILTLLLFLSVNGHLMVILALKKSFDVIPPYGFHLTGPFMENIVIFSKEIFILAVKFSAPVIAVLIFVNIGLGIMARTVPQLNMFAVGFAVTIPVGLIVMALSMPVFEEALLAAFDGMWEAVFELMKVM